MPRLHRAPIGSRRRARVWPGRFRRTRPPSRLGTARRHPGDASILIAEDDLRDGDRSGGGDPAQLVGSGHLGYLPSLCGPTSRALRPSASRHRYCRLVLPPSDRHSRTARPLIRSIADGFWRGALTPHQATRGSRRPITHFATSATRAGEAVSHSRAPAGWAPGRGYQTTCGAPSLDYAKTPRESPVTAIRILHLAASGAAVERPNRLNPLMMSRRASPSVQVAQLLPSMA